MKRAAVVTFGCKVNQYESQQIRESFHAGGYAVSDDADDADLVVINSCTVTGESDRQCRQLLRRLQARSPRPRVILTGCYAARAARELSGEFPGVEIEPVRARMMTDGARGGRPIEGLRRHSRVFVKVQDGCDAGCSYCIVPLVRPVLWSKPLPEIVAELSALHSRGYAEIVLTGVHLGRHADGIERMLERIADMPGSFRVRISSIEPGEVTPRLLSLMREHHYRVCPHLHVPLQSGSDNVLRRMGRDYAAAEFRSMADAFHAALPQGALTADVITGFPGESDDDFRATMDMVGSSGLSRVHVFRFSPRPGTRAAGFPDKVPAERIRARARELRDLGRVLEGDFLRRFTGTIRPAVSEDGGSFVLTDNYLRLPVEFSDKKMIPEGIFPARIEGNTAVPVARPVTG